MDTRRENYQVLIARTPYSESWPTLKSQLEKVYPTIGIISAFEPIMEGYEDANIKITTSTGDYVVKIFLSERTIGAMLDYAKVMASATNLGVATTELVSSIQGNIAKLSQSPASYCLITKFFAGKSFYNITPEPEDIRFITHQLALLNTLNFPIAETYDSWGNRNLLTEWTGIKHKLGEEQINLVQPVIQEFSKIDFSTFSNAVIHGDLQKKHVLKNEQGEYCIIDYGCMANAPKVIEISTHIAWFCLSENNWQSRDQVLALVLSEYQQTHKLTQYEISTIKPLVRASYAAYYQKTAELINGGDSSPETLDWHTQSQNLLNLSLSWK